MTTWASRTCLEHAKRLRELKVLLGWSDKDMAVFMYCSKQYVAMVRSYRSGEPLLKRDKANERRLHRLRWAEEHLRNQDISLGADPDILRRHLPQGYLVPGEPSDLLELPGVSFDEEEPFSPPSAHEPDPEPAVEVEAEVVEPHQHKHRDFELVEDTPVLKKALFLGLPVLYTETKDGGLAFAVTPFCEEIGIDPWNQLKKLDDPAWAARSDITVRESRDARPRPMGMVHSSSFFSWVMGINIQKVNASAAEVLTQFREVGGKWLDDLVRHGAAYNQNFDDPMAAAQFFLGQLREQEQRALERDRQREQRLLERDHQRFEGFLTLMREDRQQTQNMLANILLRVSPAEVVEFPYVSEPVAGYPGWSRCIRTGELWVSNAVMCEKLRSEPHVAHAMNRCGVDIRHLQQQVPHIANVIGVHRPSRDRRDIGPPLSEPSAPDVQHVVYFFWDHQPGEYSKLLKAVVAWANLNFCPLTYTAFSTRAGTVRKLYPNFQKARKSLSQQGYLPEDIEHFIDLAKRAFPLPGPVLDPGLNQAADF